MSDPRNVFFNIRGSIAENDVNRPVRRIEFNRIKVLPILNNPSKYEMAVQRFDIPSGLPITLWPSDPDVYRIQIYWNTSNVIEQVLFPNLCTDCVEFPRGVFNEHSIIDALNTTIITACANLKLLDPSFPYNPLQPPFFFLDDRVRFVLYIPQIYTVVPDQFRFLTTVQLYDKFFGGLEVIGFFADPNFRVVQIIIKDRQLNKQTVNGTTYLFMVPSFNTIINDAKQIVFFTNMPVVGELEPTQNNSIAHVLTDFSISGESKKEVISYYAQGPLRYYNLDSQYPLSTIDVKLFVRFVNGALYPMVYVTGQSFSIKLHFRLLTDFIEEEAEYEDNI